MTLRATYLGSNGWIIDYPNTRIIIDPWLVGDLVFPPGDWFFKGTLKEELPIPKNTDLILLTQSLPDHCHIPSLKEFGRDIDIICTKNALKILKELNFTSIKIIEPKEKIVYKGISIEATAGAAVPQVENGYIIESSTGGVYIEPHGFFDDSVTPRKLKAVITPTMNLKLPIVGSFVKGADVIPSLVKTFDPDLILSSTTGGDAQFSGFLNKYISLDQFIDNIDCKIIELNKMQSIEI